MKKLLVIILLFLTACTTVQDVKINGSVVEVGTNSVLIENDELGLIWFSLPEDFDIDLLVLGSEIYLTYDGVLKESYPYQGTAFEVLEVIELIPEITYNEPVNNMNHEDVGTMPTSNTIKNFGTCYEIFPISFADSDGDGHGDINGITENLDYFSDLGISCLWLTPLTESPSYHKYDVVDYYKIDPLFGTNEDFERLLIETENRGIKLLMDLVVNHTSKQHPWFTEKPEYYRFIEPDIPHYKYTDWHRQGDLYYYGSFWDQMPDLNLDNPDVREEIFTIAEYWINQGVDGFRLDAAKHYFDANEYPINTPVSNQNIIFLKELNMRVKQVDPNAILLTEVWSDASVVAKYYAGTDSSFNFELSDMIIETINQGSDSSAIDLVENLIEIRSTISETRTDFVDSVFLTNHDQERIMSQVASTEKAKLAANIMFTLPGISWIYYGEEIGMWGVNPHENIRQPMIFNNEYQTSGAKTEELSGNNLSILPFNEMYDHYKLLISIKEDDVLKYGDISEVTKSQRKLLAYVRTYEDTHYLVIHSLSAVEHTVLLNQEYELVYDMGYEVDITKDIILPPFASVVVEVDEVEVEFLY